MKKLKRFGKKELLENATKYQLKEVETIDCFTPFKRNVYVIDKFSKIVGYINIDLFCELKKRCVFMKRVKKRTRLYFEAFYIYTTT